MQSPSGPPSGPMLLNQVAVAVAVGSGAPDVAVDVADYFVIASGK